MSQMTFDEMERRGDWKPIHGCPGRFVLRGVSRLLSIADLIREKIEVREFSSPHANDPVFVSEFEDGGIISYKRADGTWVHTLCTRDGFERKLNQLGIENQCCPKRLPGAPRELKFIVRDTL